MQAVRQTVQVGTMNISEYKSIGTISLSIVLVFLWGLGWVLTPEGESDPLSMSASNIILEHIRPWVYITSGFYNRSILQLIPVVITTVLLGSRVEPELGTAAMLRMILFANIVSAFLIFCGIFFLYIIFRQPEILNTQIASFAGGLMCMLVARVRSAPATKLGGVELRLYPVLVCTILSLIVLFFGFFLKNAFILDQFLASVPYSIGGLYFGWFYLRFVLKHPDGTSGDTTDHFALSCFFPVAMQRCVGSIANFSLSVVHLCGYLKTHSSSDTGLLLPVTAAVSSTQDSDPVSERRRYVFSSRSVQHTLYVEDLWNSRIDCNAYRARAKKALDSKLALLAATSPLPSSAADT